GFAVDEAQSGDRAFAFLGDDLLELVAGQPGGLRSIVVESDDLAADLAGPRDRGVDAGEPVEVVVRTRGGRELRWREVALGPATPLPIGFVEWESTPPVAGGSHPN